MTATAAVLSRGKVGADAVAERAACIEAGIGIGRRAVAIGNRCAICVDLARVAVGPRFGWAAAVLDVGGSVWGNAYVASGVGRWEGFAFLEAEDGVAACCKRRKEEKSTCCPRCSTLR